MGSVTCTVTKVKLGIFAHSHTANQLIDTAVFHEAQAVEHLFVVPNTSLMVLFGPGSTHLLPTPAVYV